MSADCPYERDNENQDSRTENSLINDVKDTVLEKDIRDGDLSVVDEDCAVDRGDVDTATRKGLQRAVHQARAVIKTADDVVLEAGGKLLHADVGEDAAHGIEGVIAGRKDGQVLRGI